MAKYVVGLSWNKLTVDRIEEREVWSEPETRTGVKEWITFVVLKCVCGNELEFEEWTIDKRIHIACKDCIERMKTEVMPRTGLPGRPVKGKFKRTAITITVPLDVLDWIQEQANKRRSNTSAIITEALVEKITASGGIGKRAMIGGGEWQE